LGLWYIELVSEEVWGGKMVVSLSKTLLFNVEEKWG
jgi:hypothetical protein